MLRIFFVLALSSLIARFAFADETVEIQRVAQADEPSGNGKTGLEITSQAINALVDGDFKKAIEFTTKALGVGDLQGDDLISVYILRAEALAAMGRTDGAIDNINATLELRPDSPELTNIRGDIYLNSGQFPKALESYDESIDLKADFWEAYIDRGFAHAMLEDFDRALADASKAININPSEHTYANRADLYLVQDKFDLAIRDFTDALSQEKITNVGAYLGRAEAYYSSERYEEALQDYNKADELSPDDAVVLFLRGTTHEKLGDKANARSDLQRAGELDPENTEVRDTLERLGSK
jgi:tetratricopeptide (TPR) repeat protein